MYDGSPLSPLPILFNLVETYKVTHLGSSPRYLQILDTSGYKPNQHHDLSALRVLGVAGSVLKAELYDWVRDNLGKQVFINNGSGGTDVRNTIIFRTAVELKASSVLLDLQSLRWRSTEFTGVSC